MLDELLCYLGAELLVIKAAGELTGLLLLVPAEDLNVLAIVLVVLGDTVDETIHKDRHSRDLDATEGCNSACLREGGSRVTSKVGGLLGVEEQAAVLSPA